VVAKTPIPRPQPHLRALVPLDSSAPARRRSARRRAQL